MFGLTLIGAVVASVLYIERCNAAQDTRLENHEVRITSIEKIVPEQQKQTIDLLNQILENQRK